MVPSCIVRTVLPDESYFRALQKFQYIGANVLRTSGVWLVTLLITGAVFDSKTLGLYNLLVVLETAHVVCG